MPNVASSARFFPQQTSLPLSAISDNAYLFLDVHQRRLRLSLLRLAPSLPRKLC